jgi:hypothetical protein
MDFGRARNLDSLALGSADCSSGWGRQKIERRRNMAQQLGITMTALGLRACRIRGALEACVEAADQGVTSWIRCESCRAIQRRGACWARMYD